MYIFSFNKISHYHYDTNCGLSHILVTCRMALRVEVVLLDPGTTMGGTFT